MHEIKIFHRDLKSANIFLNKDGTAKLGDMNVSKVGQVAQQGMAKAAAKLEASAQRVANQGASTGERSAPVEAANEATAASAPVNQPVDVGPEVDLASETVKQVEAMRAYQANAAVVRAGDETSQALLSDRA